MNFECLSLLAVFGGVCGAVGGGSSQRFDCTFNNNVVSVTCSFDGGEEEDCSLPLVVTADIFGGDDHFVIFTAIDEFGQRFRIPLFFRLEGRITLSAQSCFYVHLFQLLLQVLLEVWPWLV